MSKLEKVKYETINGLTMEFTEKADARKLKWVIDNIHKLNINSQRKDQNGDKTDPIPLIKKYYRKMNLNDNTINVKYNQTEEEKGRYFSYQSISLQNIVREVRHTIAKDYYWDVDVSSAHPSFLVWYCKKHNIVCNEVQNYINNRSTYFIELKEAFKDDKEFDPKSFMLKLLNGGGKKNIIKCPNIVKNFYNEIEYIHEEISKIETKTYEFVKNKLKKEKKTNHNVLGKTMNHLLCDIENQVLFHIMNFLEYHNVKVGVMVFDGCMVEKSISYEDLIKILEKCEEYIFTQMNMQIKLTVKEMNQGFEITEEMLKDIDMTLHDTIDELINNAIDGSHKEICYLFNRIYGQNIKIIDQKEMVFFHWNEKTLLWEKEINTSMIRLFNIITPYFEDVEKQLTKKIYKLKNDEDTTDEIKNIKKQLTKIKKVLNNLGSTPFLMNCIKYYSSFEIDKHFETTINRSSLYLPIKNGYKLNLKTKEKTKRIKTDYFSFELSVDYTQDEERRKQVYKFLNDISCNNNDLVNYHIKFWGYCLTGETSDRSFHVLWGTGANGKSTVIDIMKNILSNYYTSLSDTAIMANDKSAGRATPELMALLTSRLAVLNESDEGKELNSSRIKSLTGGDTITARALFRDEIQFKTQSKIIMLTNAKPIFNINDKAMTDRIKLIPFLATFEKNKENNIYIDDLKTNYLNDFFSVFVDGAYKYLNGDELKPCSVMIDEMNKYTEELDKTKEFLNDYKLFTRQEYDKTNKEDRVSMYIKKSDLLAEYNDWCINLKEKPLKRNEFYKAVEKHVQLTPNLNGKNTEAFLLRRN